MPTLLVVCNEIEAALVEVLKDAWGCTKVYTSPRGLVEIKLTELPLAYLRLEEAVPSEEEEQTMCSESARLVWSATLQAKKPTGGTLAIEKRTQAQALRTALKAATVPHTELCRWEGDQYEPEEAEAESTAEDYKIRVRFSTYVGWTD